MMVTSAHLRLFTKPAALVALTRAGTWLPFAQDNDTVRVRRRRRAGPDDSGARERAETPQRRRTGTGSPPPPSSGSGGSGGAGGSSGGGSGGGGLGGGSRPPQLPGGLGGGRLLIMLALIVAGVIFGLPALINLGTSLPQGNQNDAPLSVATVAPTAIQQAPATRAAPTPTRAASIAGGALSTSPSSAGGETWTIMLYQDADDKVLERDIYVDLNEAERIGSSDQVHIVAQIDRYQGGYQGDGDWTTAKRFYVTQDDDLERVGSQELADLGEVNMADAATLVDFVAWAIEAYPADKYALIMSDHGLGWPGGWSDPTARGGAVRGVPLSNKLGDQLYLAEIDAALQEIRERTGLDKFELIGMDACLMAHLEVFAALAPHARYAVASQETEPALGWAYTSFLEGLTANPAMNGAELSQLIIDTYIDGDQRIVDDQARAELVGRAAPMGGLFDLLLGGGLGTTSAPSAEQVASEMRQKVTLSAVDLGAMPALMDSVNELSHALQEINQKQVAQARSYAQSYTSIFGPQVPASYIDLGHFVQLLQQQGASGDLSSAINGVLANLDQVVVANMYGPQRSGATGISIYFPISQLYGTGEAGPQSYTAISQRFATNSLWDDFLAFHYTGRRFEAAQNRLAIPEQNEPIQAPGAGPLTISAVTASDAEVAPGQTVLLSAQIQGENVGHVYLFAGFYDQGANAIFTADMDYLESDDTRELAGVYYPVWPEDGDFTLEFEWEPIVFGISDGQTTEVAMFKPATYGANFENAIYTVDGTYTYAEDGESRVARLYFRNGILRQVFGFTGSDGSGAPREIIPQSGDTFTIAEQWMDLGANGQVTGVATQPGGTLTFGPETFTWTELDAAAGEYIVGFIVEDLDGNTAPSYTRVTVQ